MDQRQFLKRLIQDREGNPTAAAKAMGAPHLQPSIARFLAGTQRALAPHNATIIANHYGVSVAAMWSAEAARAEAARIWPDGASPDVQGASRGSPAAPPTGVTHRVTLDRITVSFRSWEDLMSAKTLEPLFLAKVPDSSMAPGIRERDVYLWAADVPAAPGDVVILKTADGAAHVRRCVEVSPGVLVYRADNPHAADLSGHVVAVMLSGPLPIHRLRLDI